MPLHIKRIKKAIDINHGKHYRRTKDTIKLAKRLTQPAFIQYSWLPTVKKR